MTVLDILSERLIEAFGQLVDDIISAILAPGENWQILFLGILVGQGPFQLWEAGILDALDRFRATVSSAGIQALNEAIIRKGIDAIADSKFNSRVFTGTATFDFVLYYLLVDSQNTALFNPAGLVSLVGRVESRLASPLRRILALARGGSLFGGFISTIAKTSIGIAVALMRAGGYLALALTAARATNDILTNPRGLFKRALSQNNQRFKCVLPVTRRCRVKGVL